MAKIKKRILVVDDEESFARLLKWNLEQTEEYEVQVEHGAAGALAYVETTRPDLILLDVMMPEMDGGDLAAYFLANPKLTNVPIIFLTAAVKPEEVSSRGGRIGGLPFIAKPVDFEEVIRCLKAQLGS